MADRYTKTTLANVDAGDGGNYAGDSLTSSAYRWTASGSGTNEYYCELSGGGDPSITSPDALTINGAVASTATLGSLTAGTWNYGNNDGLAFSTVYVRLSDNTDPDTKIDGYIEANYLPATNDNLFFQHTSTISFAGSDQSGVELDDIAVLPSCTGNAGSADDYLQLDQGTANSVTYEGGGTWYLDMGTSGSASVRVNQSLKPSGGLSGLYFKNNTNAITEFIVSNASVRLVDAVITTLTVNQGAVVIIDDDCTITTIVNNGGTIIDYGCALTTWTQIDGTGTKTGSDAYVLNIHGGTFYNDGTGTVTATVDGGTFDSARDGRSKNVTLTLNNGTAILGSAVTPTITLNSTTTLNA